MGVTDSGKYRARKGSMSAAFFWRPTLVEFDVEEPAIFGHGGVWIAGSLFVDFS